MLERFFYWSFTRGAAVRILSALGLTVFCIITIEFMEAYIADLGRLVPVGLAGLS